MHLDVLPSAFPIGSVKDNSNLQQTTPTNGKVASPLPSPPSRAMPSAALCCGRAVCDMALWLRGEIRGAALLALCYGGAVRNTAQDPAANHHHRNNVSKPYHTSDSECPQGQSLGGALEVSTTCIASHGHPSTLVGDVIPPSLILRLRQTAAKS